MKDLRILAQSCKELEELTKIDLSAISKDRMQIEREQRKINAEQKSRVLEAELRYKRMQG